MIRRRGYGFYKPPQYVTGRIDDFPLVPETPIDIVPRPILPSPAAPAESIAGELAAPAPPAAAHTIAVAVQPPPVQKATAGAETKAADQQLEDAAKSLKRVLTKMKSLGLDEPDDLAPISPEPPRASIRRNPPRAYKNLSPRQRHSRLCTVCQHPDRDAIEEEFIHWHNPNDTRYDYQISRAALYRHAHAVGLFARRERNLRSALGHMIQGAMNITPTSDSILRAIRAYSCLNRDGQWTELPSHVVVSSGSAVYGAARALPPVLDVPPARQIAGGPAAARPARRAKKPHRTHRKSRRSTRNTLTNRKRRK
jgi:hypothetical protein